MSLGAKEHEERYAGLAYRLGYASVDFERRARACWEFAAKDEPFPTELERFVQDVRDASKGLIPLLPERTWRRLSESLRNAVTHALDALGGAWLGTDHLAMLDLLDRAEPEEDVNPFGSSPFDEEEWTEFRLASELFSNSLPKPISDSASLGVHVAAARDVLPDGTMLRGIRHLVDGSPFSVIEELLPAFAAKFPLFHGMEIDLSVGRYREADAGPGTTYWEWELAEVARLHRAILDLGTDVAPVEPEEEWISATRASRLAEVHFHLPLSLPDITKLASNPNPPFKTRRQRSPKNNREMRNRREVELTSFIKYLWKRVEPEVSQPADQSVQGDQEGQTIRAGHGGPTRELPGRDEPSAEEEARISRSIAEDKEQRRRRRLKDAKDKGQLDKDNI